MRAGRVKRRHLVYKRRTDEGRAL